MAWEGRQGEEKDRIWWRSCTPSQVSAFCIHPWSAAHQYQNGSKL